jgi:hypothetical protein
MRLLSGALALLLAQAGCTVSATRTGEDPRPSNACTNGSDCDNAACVQGVCQALNGQLDSLLISASPPSDSPFPHLTFVTPLTDVFADDGALDISLPGATHIIGNFTLPKGDVCYPGFVSDDPNHSIGPADDGKTLPVTVTLALTQRLLGLPQQLYLTSTFVRNDIGGYTFDVQVPGGEYDVYLVPPPKQQGCPVPPQIYRGVKVEGNPFIYTFVLSGVSRLPLDILWPVTSASLKGWMLDIIEPLGGNPISTQVVLPEPSADEDSPTVKYSATLSYSTVVQPEGQAPAAVPETAGNLLRLRPPAGLVAPSIFLARSALGLLSNPNELVELKRFTRVPSSVKVEGRMEQLDGAAPVGGYVTLTSTEIYGVDPGVFAAYQTTVQVDVDGAVHVELPPGKYRVQAVPPPLGEGSTSGSSLAALETIWDIPPDVSPQYGKVLQLVSAAELSGQSQFPGSQVQLVPSPETILPFDQAFGAAQLAVRASTALVNDAGDFVVRADPGRFDLSIRAPESAGFGWFVWPGVVVAAGQASLDLGRVALPKPSLLYGTAGLAPGGDASLLASAAIRAYAYLDKDLAYTRDPQEAVAVVQVAETRADEHGAYRLLLPSRIDAPK